MQERASHKTTANAAAMVPKRAVSWTVIVEAAPVLMLLAPADPAPEPELPAEAGAESVLLPAPVPELVPEEPDSDEPDPDEPDPEDPDPEPPGPEAPDEDAPLDGTPLDDAPLDDAPLDDAPLDDTPLAPALFPEPEEPELEPAGALLEETSDCELAELPDGELELELELGVEVVSEPDCALGLEPTLEPDPEEGPDPRRPLVLLEPEMPCRP